MNKEANDLAFAKAVARFVALEAGSQPAPKQTWCPQCETRDASKAYAPYCSLICQEAAQRAAMYDRR